MPFEESRARIARYLKTLPESRRALFGSLADEVAFLESKLEESRLLLEVDGFSYQPVDQDGAPTGIRRKNPEFEIYLSAFSQYCRALAMLAPPERAAAGAEEPQPKSSLADFKSKYSGLRLAK